MLQLLGVLLLTVILIIALLGLIESYWWIGALFALLMFKFVFNKYEDSKLTDEQWHAKYPDMAERVNHKGSMILYTALGIIFCLASYLPFQYQAEAEKRDIERVSQLNDEERKIFDEHFQAYMQESNSDEVSARKKALKNVDEVLLAKAEAEQKAREEEQARLAAEQKAREEEQARLAAEQKAREEEQARLAAEQKAREEEQRKADKMNRKSPEKSEPVTVAQGRLNIEQLESVNANVLADQVIEYINANPDKKGRLISYIFNLEILSNKYDSEIKRLGHSDGEVLANSIPLIGGLIVDKSWDSLTNAYKRAIVNEINNDGVMRNILDARHANNLLRDAAYNELSKRYLIDPDDIENYNALIKIAAIKYHSVEAYAEDHKGRFSLDPGVFDVIDVVSYAVFSAKENQDKYKSAQQALARICAELSIDSNNCRTKEEMEKYFASLIPRHMFAYELEETYLPADKNSVFTENSVSPEDRRRVYEMLRGTWRSLVTEKTAVIETFPENDYSARTPRVNYIDVLDKKESYARFNYLFPSGNRVNVFITPAFYVKDGRKTKVLVMYSNYELIKGGESSIYKNGRVENIISAEDVFIREP